MKPSWRIVVIFVLIVPGALACQFLDLISPRIAELTPTIAQTRGRAELTPAVAESRVGTLFPITAPTPTQKLSVAPTPTPMPRATVTAGISLPLLRTLIGHRNNINAIAFSPDGTMLASASSDSVLLWRVSDGTLLRTLRREGGGGESVSVAFSPDGARLASGTTGTDASIHLWRVSDGSLLHTLRDKEWNWNA
ncbi:MAG: PD40 domain-containing protein, partial [Chloroflexota bacterium]|nr:PD40 domain-containing protein [Chloroflexota bacterium]